MAILFPVKSEMAILFFVKRDPGPPFTTLCTGDKQTAEFEFFCGVFRERYKMFSKVKRPLEIERDSSPKRAKSRKVDRYNSAVRDATVGMG